LLAWIALGVGAGGTLAAWLLPGRGKSELPPESPLRFPERVLDVREKKYYEGDTVEAEASLENTSAEPVRVTRLRTSCGCMAVSAGDLGNPPFTLNSGQSAPVRITVNTNYRAGEQSLPLRVEAETPGGQALPPADMLLRIYVRTTIRAFPDDASFTVNEEDLTRPLPATFILADTWPEENLAVKSVTSDLGDGLRWEVHPVDGEIERGSSVYRKRWQLDVSFSPDPQRTTFDFPVTVTLDHAKAKPVVVHLRGRVLPRCYFTPDSLSLAGASGEIVVRKLEYRYRGDYGELRAVSSPPWLSVVTEDAGQGSKRLTVTARLPEGAGAHEVQLEAGRGADRRTLVLPIYTSSTR
jgi:hypothetical protein